MPSALINQDAYKVVSCLFCALATIAATARTAIRVYNRQLRFSDDLFLLIAVLGCIVATVLQNIGGPDLYAITLADPAQAQAIPLEIINKTISKIQRYTWSFAAVVWVSIFAVKCSYLAFFRLLIDRQFNLLMYWRAVLVFTCIASIFNIFDSFISCSEFGDNAYKCANAYYAHRVLVVESITNTLDILTDLFIASIPVFLLHKVSIRRRQKIGLGCFLCLSLFMVIIAIVRVAPIRNSGWQIWGIFWQQMESCFAIIMLSTTAFRQLFVHHTSSAYRQRHAAGAVSPDHSDYSGPSEKRKRSWWSSKKWLSWSHTSPRNSDSNRREKDTKPRVSLPIPRGTMTGIETFIQGESKGTRETESQETLDHGSGILPMDSIFIRRDLEAMSQRPSLNEHNARPSFQSYV